MLPLTRFACLTRTTQHARSHSATSSRFVTSSAATSIKEERRIFDGSKNAMASTRALHASSKVSSALKPVVYSQFLLLEPRYSSNLADSSGALLWLQRSKKVKISCWPRVLPTLRGTNSNTISDVGCIAYICRLDFINRDFSGFNTTQGLKSFRISSQIRVELACDSWHKSLVMITSFGPDPSRPSCILYESNDVCSASCLNGQHIPFEQYKKNLFSLVNHPVLQARGTRVILMTPLPVEEGRLEHRVKSQGYKESNRRNEVTKQTADRSISDPLYGSIDLPEKEAIRALNHDGLHFTPKAYGIFYEEMMTIIAGKWPDQIPEKLPYIISAWGDTEAWAREGLRMGSSPDVDRYN